ncbi:hypothetical protein ATL17_1595 [Maritalea mobilis]|uniref:Uncharacterized protein n=1 Tax=Maritalea mobilis TaxID=483324 RepID=A0A4R6VJB3_9HYPH|nr:hypothetical protein [Maritalea mobilis]TDQ63588.1 hypothetical protein ATL17_1595 [Maritalea mobilis]
MTERLDALMVRGYTDREGNQKNNYTKIGVAFPMPNGGYRLKLEAIPVPTIYDGKVECSMILVPPRQQDGQQSNQRADGRPGDSRFDPKVPDFGDQSDDDDLPF